jgi:hypothetical protein
MISKMFRVFILLGALTACAASDCKEWTSPKYGYALCLPGRWYHRMMPSGALFLCDEPHGRCTTARGGGPLSGHVTLSVVPAQVVVDATPAKLQEFAHLVAEKESSSRLSEIYRVRGRSGTIEYLIVQQTFTTGGLNEIPQDVYLYFAKANHQMIELILTFNAGDKRSSAYKDVAVEVIRSIRLR